MNLAKRFGAAVAAFRNKGVTVSSNETMTLNQLMDFLGIQDVSADARNEATYFACCKVLSESIGKLPLKIQQATPDHGVEVKRDHPYYRMLNERPNRHMTASVFWGTM